MGEAPCMGAGDRRVVQGSRQEACGVVPRGCEDAGAVRARTLVRCEWCVEAGGRMQAIDAVHGFTSRVQATAECEEACGYTSGTHTPLAPHNYYSRAVCKRPPSARKHVPYARKHVP